MTTAREQTGFRRGIGVGVDKLHGMRSAGLHAAFLLEHLAPTAQVLDVGCGPGSITLGLAEAVEQGSVVGIDADAARIDEARKAAKAQAISNASFLQADIYSLPYPDDQFDAVYQHAVLEHLDDPIAASREVLRVVKPGGIFASTNYIASQSIVFMNGVPQDQLQSLVDVVRDIQAGFGHDVDFGLRVGVVLHEAGFVEIANGAYFEPFSTNRQRQGFAKAFTEKLNNPRAREVAQSQGINADTLASLVDLLKRFEDSPLAWGALANGTAIGRKPMD